MGSWTPELLFCCSSDVERSGASVSILCLLTSGLNRSLLTVFPLLPPVCFPGATEATPSQVADLARPGVWAGRLTHIVWQCP